MAEGPRSRSQPFRFWMPAGIGRSPGGSAPRPAAALSRLRSRGQTPPQPPARAAASPLPSRPPSFRRPTSGQRDSSAQDRRRRPSQSRPGTQTESPSATGAATQVKPQLIPSNPFLLNYSQRRPPAPKTTTPSVPKPADCPAQPTPEPDALTINSLEQQPAVYLSGSSLHRENAKTFNLEKTEQIVNPEEEEESQENEPTSTTSAPEAQIEEVPSTRNSASNAEHDVGDESKRARDGTSRKEQKVAISPIALGSLFDGKRAVFREDIKEGLSRLAEKTSAGYSSVQPRNGSSSSANVVTLAGKNSGASMVIGYEERPHHNLGKSTGSGAWNDDEKTGITASINNNIQSINNSAIDDSSCRVGNPGVHLKISSRPTERSDLDKTAETQLRTERRAPVPIRSPGERPAREPPRIRRRCLRALLMESGESDLENPQKPRRHGCRFSCEARKKGEGTEN